MMIESNHLFSLERIDNIRLSDKQFENIVLIYVAHGNIMINVDNNQFELGEQRIFIVNPSNTISVSSVDSKRETQAYLMHLNIYEVQLTLEKPFVFFTNLEKHESKEWHAMCIVMEKIISHYDGDDRCAFTKLTQNIFFCQLLHAMIPFLLSEQDCVYEDAPLIMNQVFWYLQSHYAERITLQEISEHFYVSDSSLSRWIKQYTGMNFEKYLRKLRAVHCALEISNTDKSITEIALEHGFSNPAALNKAFHEFYHMTPGKYRDAHLPHWEKGTVYHVTN